MTNAPAERYPVEVLDPDYDDGTMPERVQTLRDNVIGRRIVAAEQTSWDAPRSPWTTWTTRVEGFVLTLDNGRQVRLVDNGDCCAFTSLERFLLHPDRIDHVITGVGTTDGYTKWHIYADLGDVLELDVEWSAGNTGYYGYGFDISVTDLTEGASE